MATGVKSSVQVKPSYGLSDDEIARMLKESMGSAAADRDARKLREQEVEAERLTEALATALEADGHELLSKNEFNRLVADLEKPGCCEVFR